MREPRGVAELAGVGRLELPTLGLEIRCSIQLSYTPLRTYSIDILSLLLLASLACPEFGTSAIPVSMAE